MLSSRVVAVSRNPPAGSRVFSSAFLTRLASCPQANFAALARDLALIPRLRLPVLMTLRNASADSPLGQALAALTRQAETGNPAPRH